MSQTISVGVVGASHWTYMATVMAERLDEAYRTNRIVAGSIPAGVYRDALAFSQLALQATGSSVPDNPPASLNAYVIASDVLRHSSHEPFPTSEDVNSQLQRYGTFLRSLSNASREVSSAERETLESLVAFFQCLKEEGESEAYSRTLHFEIPQPAFLR